MKDDLVIIVPCKNEEETINIFIKEIKKIKEKINGLSVLFVDDGSTDKTLKVIDKLAKNTDWVHYISLSRNFGKEAAIYAGLLNSDGKYTAIMDVDLQDPPKLLIEMYNDLENEDYNIITARRTTRVGESKIRTFFARLFYKIMDRISDSEVIDGARDFSMFDSQVKEAILSMEEYNRFTKGIIGWIGFNRKCIEYENVERVSGKSSWSFLQLTKYAIDGITAFSTTPLLLISVLGGCVSIVSVVIAIIQLTQGLLNEFRLCFDILLLLGGLIIISLGIVGQYISKIYTETKHRPNYFIKKRG